ncbi:MAG: DUF882 domain-containing protein [Magnetococcales bacterium]|nr:DUF882 domain-containing protein [Magnetococcales bacterium]
MNVTDHFTDAELRCRHCGKMSMNESFLRKLESLRVAFGKPMKINSAYRCPAHNAAVGEGKLVGAHTMGCAIDVAVSGEDVPRLIQLAMQHGFTGFGIKQHGPIEGRYVHLDTVPPGTPGVPRPRFWSYP